MKTEMLRKFYSTRSGLDGEEVDFDLDIYPYEFDRFNFTLEDIAEGFADMGMPVSVDALAHNLTAWMADCKSGYLDRENGSFVFTPCGCNPLSFRVQRLDGEPKDYQKTYEC